MTAILLPSGRLRYHAYIDGVYGPAVGYKLYTYAAGTTTPKATYADADATTPLANPIVLDARGECAPYGTGSYKLLLTDPGAATVPGWPQDNVSLSSSYAEEEWCGTAGGTADAIALSPTIGISTYLPGQRFSFAAASANTGAVTVAVDGLAAKALTWNGNTALAANDLVPGRIYQMQYDGTRFQISAIPAASDLNDDSERAVSTKYFRDSVATTTRVGTVELATSAEAIAGTDAERAITPATLFGGLNATGTAPIYAARAWIVFNGAGTPAIKASGNIASVTDLGVGLYRLTFTVDMPDANYAVTGTCLGVAANSLGSVSVRQGTTPTASSVDIAVYHLDGGSPANIALVDSTRVSVVIHR